MAIRCGAQSFILSVTIRSYEPRTRLKTISAMKTVAGDSRHPHDHRQHAREVTGAVAPRRISTPLSTNPRRPQPATMPAPSPEQPSQQQPNMNELASSSQGSRGLPAPPTHHSKSQAAKPRKAAPKRRRKNW